MQQEGPIGVFDSGYGGLTILKKFVDLLPQYDYIYLGDNARAPYGNRSFETVYHYTLECVKALFDKGCPLVILACNTASAKALRTIQQNDLPELVPEKRVLGVIRPTTESIGASSKTLHIGVLGTSGTVQSDSYPIEIAKFFPEAHVFQEACPMWVPLVENNEFDKPGADYFIKQHITNLIKQSERIDTFVLACTHYPLLLNKIKQYTPSHINIIAQGDLVANSLKDYLVRHPEMEKRLSGKRTIQFFTTETSANFDKQAALFFERALQSEQLVL